MRRYPTGTYGRQRLEFFPAPRKSPLRAFAALVFPWYGEQLVLCDIVDRGWCIPSGRVEPEESSLDAVRREAREEAGAELGAVHYIGCYRITERREVRWADCFTARVSSLVEIAMPEESRGRRLTTMDELPQVYHEWNELIKLVFELAHESLLRSESPPAKQ